MKNLKQLVILLLFGLLCACSSTPEKGDADTQQSTTPDASTQGLSELDSLDGDKMSEVVPYDDSYGVQGPDAEPGEPLSVRTFYFDFDSSQVRSEDYQAINAHADYLLANPESVISLEGHTDQKGTREYNIALGEQRAISVAKMMQIKGVNDSQIQAVSYGEEKSASPGNDEYAQSQNRRVEIIYLK
ncbi:MAG: peptidoglycan-associated lipoprotein Pal [Methylococcales bacterium]